MHMELELAEKITRRSGGPKSGLHPDLVVVSVMEDV